MQGFNMGRYYPPDASNPPAFNATSKSSSTAPPTIRFELPFAVWCTHCTPEAIVGQGVRFNAQKTRVGNYYSTPIWSFRMKHSACGGWWEIRTDPAKSEYVAAGGCRRREYGVVDDGAVGELKFLTEEERERRRADGFAGLEGRVEQRAEEKGGKERVEELYERSEWGKDVYGVNARMRRVFRAERRVWKEEERWKEGVQEKFSLGLDIVDENEGDRARAKLVDFAAVNADEKGESTPPTWKPLFDTPDRRFIPRKSAITPLDTKLSTLKPSPQQPRHNLQNTLISNTKAAIDPFLVHKSPTPSRLHLGLLKRKRASSEVEKPAQLARTDTPTTVRESDDSLIPANTNEMEKEGETETSALALALAGYDSD